MSVWYFSLVNAHSEFSICDRIWEKVFRTRVDLFAHGPIKISVWRCGPFLKAKKSWYYIFSTNIQIYCILKKLIVWPGKRPQRVGNYPCACHSLPTLEHSAKVLQTFNFPSGIITRQCYHLIKIEMQWRSKVVPPLAWNHCISSWKDHTFHTGSCISHVYIV